jgi:hypothetical protein
MMVACVKKALISLSLIQGAVVCRGFDDSCVRNFTTRSSGDFGRATTIGGIIRSGENGDEVW